MKDLAIELNFLQKMRLNRMSDCSIPLKENMLEIQFVWQQHVFKKTKNNQSHASDRR